MAEFPAMPLWTDALIADTVHLTPAEFGAYLLLLIAEWRAADCALDDDDVKLGRIVRDPKNWRRLRAAVMPFFTKREDGKLIQKRLVRERELARERSNKQADRAIGRWAKERHQRAVAEREQDTGSHGELELGSPGEHEAISRNTNNQLKGLDGPGAAVMPETMPDECRNDASISISTSMPPNSVEFGGERSRTDGVDPQGELASQGARNRPKRASKHTPARRLPEDWTPSERNLNDAADRGLMPERIAREAAQFRDHYLGRGEARVDWDAIWRTWLGNMDRFGPPRQASAPAAAPASVADQLRFYADWVKSDRHMPPTAMTSTRRAELLAAGLVTEADLRKKGL